MGAALNAGPRKGGSRRRPTMSEINVTPLVDVMLVLLIVFMVTAPLMTVGVPVDLPKTAAASLNDKVEPLTISLDAKGRIFIQETEISQDQLVPRLKAITVSKPDTAIYVRGDKGINYGRVMEVMGMVAAAGFQKVSLIAEMPGSSPTPAPQQRRPNR